MPSPQTKKVQPTVEEIIATLKRSSLPTIICEGSDDLIVYRRIEDRLSHLGVSVLPAGGRRNVLEIFNRRGEISNAVRLAFIADRDTWVNTAVPQAYLNPVLCLTHGYSIENDIIADGELESLLTGAALTNYKEELKTFLDWYALALSRHLTNQEEPISHHPERVLESTDRATLTTLKPDESYPTALRARLNDNYRVEVRGKSLLSLLVRNTNTRRGEPRHTDKSLLEIVAARPGALLAKIEQDLTSVFT